MTGYSRITRDLGGAPFTVSIRAVNRRSFDLTCNLPPFLTLFEIKIRKWISQRIQRGALSLNIHWPKALSFTPNLPMIRELKEIAKVISQETGLPFAEAFALAMRGRDSDLLSPLEVSVGEEGVKEIVIEAANALVEMGLQEGKMMANDLLTRCQQIEKLSKAVAKRVEGTSERVREKLIERLKEWTIEDERLMKEVALYAERADVTEEIVRFGYHLKMLTERIQGKEPAQGKMCEFTVQEMVREINTLGAKAQDSEVGRDVVEIKGQLEKIREQLQNVE